MEMVAHQHVTVQDHLVQLLGILQEDHELLAVLVTSEDALPGMPTTGHMVAGIRVQYSQLSHHDRIPQILPLLSNVKI
jgi:hypothetical protein